MFVASASRWEMSPAKVCPRLCSWPHAEAVSAIKQRRNLLLPLCLPPLNETLRSDFPQGNFVTMIYAVLDTARAVLTLAAAGHPSPLLVTNRTVEVLELPNGLPLGLRDWSFEEVTLPLDPESAVLLYSDGVL